MQAEPASHSGAGSRRGQVSSVPPVPVGVGGHGLGDDSGITPTSEQFELAKKSIKRWKKAYQREQFHSRVVMGVSIGVALLGLLFGYMQMNRANDGAGGAGNGAVGNDLSLSAQESE